MLAEVGAGRRLRGLRLHLVAPTVLLSDRPLTETLAALRGVGYSPLAEDAYGTPVWDGPMTHRRAVPTVRRAGRRSAPDRPAPSDPRQLAETLLGRGISAAPGVFATLLAVRRGASRRSAAEARLLAQAVDTGTAVRIDYLSSTRSTTSRIIEDLEPDGGAWTPGAYCATANAGSPSAASWPAP